MTGRHHHKVRDSVAAALDGLESGMTVMVGGFGLCGNAEALIRGVIDKGVKDLTLVSNNAGNLGKGLATWLRADIVKKVICSYLGTNEDLHSRMASGVITVEVTPQGTLAERMRAAGAGIAAFFTPTGVGTVVEEGKEKRTIDGREYLLEKALPADFALIRARTVDHFGNLLTNLAACPAREVLVAGRPARVVTTYGEGEPGEPIALVNAWGFWEIAVHGGNAARSLGASGGAVVTVRA